MAFLFLPADIGNDDMPLDKYFPGILESLASAGIFHAGSQEAVSCCGTFKHLLPLGISIKNQGASILPPPSSPAPSTHAHQLSPEGGTRCPKVGDETGNCLESQAPRKQHSENKSCYFNYGSCGLLSHHSLSHMFIRNLVINHSLEARSCQSHCLQLSALLPRLRSPGAFPDSYAARSLQDWASKPVLNGAWESD